MSISFDDENAVVDNCGVTSIIILTRDKLEYTQACIESVRTYTRPGTYEIIVVDNHSTDGTVEWLQEQTDIRCIFNDENRGFPAGCNQGIISSRGSNILLLNNDTVVTVNWLENLLKCLYSSDEIGAVGPVTNQASYYQSIPVTYKTLDEMQMFAKAYNLHNPNTWEQRLKLVGFCFLIKKDIVDKIGLLDERFSPGNFEDDDYSFRIMQAGYKLMLCKDVFIHHFGSTSFRDNPSFFNQLLKDNEQKFVDKWGFNSSYSTFIRHELIQLMDDHRENEQIKVLEVGCACGGTLLQIKNKYRMAQVYGIELNESSSSIASLFAEVKAANVEQDLDYPPNFFDYIILADVLEHLYDPWKVVASLKGYLKDTGKLLVSIPNVMHYTVLRDVLNGHWTYTDAGLLDRTHVRFFTLDEIDKMFNTAGFEKREYSANVIPIPDEDMKWVYGLGNLSSLPNEDQFKVYQYLVKVDK